MRVFRDHAQNVLIMGSEVPDLVVRDVFPLFDIELDMDTYWCPVYRMNWDSYMQLVRYLYPNQRQQDEQPPRTKKNRPNEDHCVTIDAEQQTDQVVYMNIAVGTDDEEPGAMAHAPEEEREEASASEVAPDVEGSQFLAPNTGEMANLVMPHDIALADGIRAAERDDVSTFDDCISGISSFDAVRDRRIQVQNILVG